MKIHQLHLAILFRVGSDPSQIVDAGLAEAHNFNGIEVFLG
jgi:hypothetical protein